MFYDMWNVELAVPGSFEVLESVGCEPLPAVGIPYHRRIGVGEWIVAVTPILHHEL